MIQKPYAISLKGITIDTNASNKVTWKVSGSVQTAFQVFIFSNVDNSLVYDSLKQNSYSLEYDIPSNTLVNGNEYKIQIQVWDANNNTATSDNEIFQTSSTPSITVNAIPTIASSSYSFVASYSQAESVGIKSYSVFLYDSLQKLIKQSGILTTSSQTLEYLFSDLKSEQTYYVEFQATSNKGLIGKSGKIEFQVLYTQPTVNVSLSAENVDNAGIKLSWNVVQILGESDTPVTYLNSEKVDLTGNNRVWFEEGFSLQKNFTLKLWIEQPINNVDLLIIKGSNGELRLKYNVIDEKFHLTKLINNIASDWETTTLSGSSYFVCIQQIDSDINFYGELIF